MKYYVLSEVKNMTFSLIFFLYCRNFKADSMEITTLYAKTTQFFTVANSNHQRTQCSCFDPHINVFTLTVTLLYNSENAYPGASLLCSHFLGCVARHPKKWLWRRLILALNQKQKKKTSKTIIHTTVHSVLIVLHR